MEIKKILEHIYHYYPVGIAATTIEYGRSPEIAALQQIIAQMKADTLWNQLQQELTDATGQSVTKAEILPVYPSCSFMLTSEASDGYILSIKLLVSIILPVWSLCAIRIKHFDTAELINAIRGDENDAREIASIADKGEREERIKTQLRKKLGDDYDQKEIKWLDYPQQAQQHVAVITTILERHGYWQFPASQLFEIVPDVATFYRTTLNSATFFDCLFNDRNQV